MYRKTIQELENDTRDLVVIDVRKADDFERESYPSALHIYWEEFMNHKERLPNYKPIYLLG